MSGVDDSAEIFVEEAKGSSGVENRSWRLRLVPIWDQDYKAFYVASNSLNNRNCRLKLGLQSYQGSAIVQCNSKIYDVNRTKHKNLNPEIA